MEPFRVRVGRARAQGGQQEAAAAAAATGVKVPKLPKPKVWGEEEDLTTMLARTIPRGQSPKQVERDLADLQEYHPDEFNRREAVDQEVSQQMDKALSALQALDEPCFYFNKPV